MLSDAPLLTPIATRCAEELKIQINRELDIKHQREWGQYFTSAKIASWMSSWFEVAGENIKLLDAGAGVGSLSAALVSELCARAQRPNRLDIVAYEADSLLIPALQQTLRACQTECEQTGIELQYQIVNADFIQEGTAALDNQLFAANSPLQAHFDCAFLNPPYRKISANSQWRRSLSAVGIETSNLYAAFVWLATRLLKPTGELVAITPRSWCNGPYFKPLRLALRETMHFRRVHLFESRREAFGSDDVLQENIVFRAVKMPAKATPISISVGPQNQEIGQFKARIVAPSELFRPNDSNAFVYLESIRTATGLREGSLSLKELNLSVSTGRVVDFRCKSSLRAHAHDREEALAPLIYPLHFQSGTICWPRPDARKPNALVIDEQTQRSLCAPGVYVLVKRFSSKEQKKRICAAIFDSRELEERWHSTPIGFENHLNYFHAQGKPLSLDLAMGLAIYLNSTWVDELFRSFNGHTQVNATDLRSLPYPSTPTLQGLGAQILATQTVATLPPQKEVDALIDALLKQD